MRDFSHTKERQLNIKINRKSFYCPLLLPDFTHTTHNIQSTVQRQNKVLIEKYPRSCDTFFSFAGFILYMRVYGIEGVLFVKFFKHSEDLCLLLSFLFAISRLNDFVLLNKVSDCKWLKLKSNKCDFVSSVVIKTASLKSNEKCGCHYSIV